MSRNESCAKSICDARSAIWHAACPPKHGPTICRTAATPMPLHNMLTPLPLCAVLLPLPPHAKPVLQASPGPPHLPQTAKPYVRL